MSRLEENQYNLIDHSDIQHYKTMLIDKKIDPKIKFNLGEMQKALYAIMMEKGLSKEEENDDKLWKMFDLTLNFNYLEKSHVKIDPDIQLRLLWSLYLD